MSSPCRSWSVVLLAGTAVLFGTACDDPDLGVQSAAFSVPIDRQALAAYWSPIIYHDTHFYSDKTSPSPHQYKHDYITKFNYDGNYAGRDNWDNLRNNFATPAAVYYSVSETLTHYFIGYYLFHPRDENAGITDSDTHENDLEGMILAIRKVDGSSCMDARGCLIAMETQAHGRLYQYGYAAGITAGAGGYGALESDAPDPFRVKIGKYVGRDNKAGTADDGAVGIHPLMFVENRGHGVLACDAVSSANTSQDCEQANDGNGIVYYYSDGTSDSPHPTTGGNGNFTQRYRYSLIAMDQCGPGSSCGPNDDRGLWTLRYYSNDNPLSPDNCDETETCPYRSWAGMAGDGSDGHRAGGELPMWWDDEDDGPSYAGDWLCDPASFFDIHMNGAPFDTGFSHTYSDHSYWTHYVEIDSIRVDDASLLGQRLHVNVNASNGPSNTNTVVDWNHWRRTINTAGIWHPWRYGADQAQAGLKYGDDSSRHYFCRPQSSIITFSVRRDNGTTVATDVQLGPKDYRAGRDLGPVAMRYRHVQNQANQGCCGSALDVRTGLEAEQGVLTSPMVSAQSWQASTGKYIQVPNGAGAGGDATYAFQIAREGWYHIWGRESSPSSNDDSFFVSVDDGPAATWDAQRTSGASEFVWDRVSDRTMGEIRFYLEPGPHTLRIDRREDGTKLDRLLIVSDADFVPYDVQVEAEAGTIVWPMRATTNYADNYVWVPNGGGAGGSATYSLSVPTPGQYLVWGRVNAPTSGDDSFYVSVNGGAAKVWDTIRTTATAWAWDVVSDRGIGDAVFYLQAGANSIRVSQREDGTKLDQLILTNDLGFTPADHGVPLGIAPQF